MIHEIDPGSAFMKLTFYGGRQTTSKCTSETISYGEKYTEGRWLIWGRIMGGLGWLLREQGRGYSQSEH